MEYSTAFGPYCVTRSNERKQNIPVVGSTCVRKLYFSRIDLTFAIIRNTVRYKDSFVCFEHIFKCPWDINTPVGK